MNTKIFLSAAIFALTVTAACSDDKDTTGPEINLLQPQNEDAFKEGATHVRVFTQPVIPADAQEGEYHLGVIATDMLGNESQLYIDIVIKEE
jgi:hypothetical protein